MGEMTFIERLFFTLKQIFCKHHWEAEIWDESVLIQCLKCHKNYAVEKLKEEEEK